MTHTPENGPKTLNKVRNLRTNSKTRDPRTDAWLSWAGSIARAANLRSISSQALAAALEQGDLLAGLGLPIPAIRPPWYLALLETAPDIIGGAPPPDTEMPLGLAKEIPDGVRILLLQGGPLQACIEAFKEGRDPAWVRLFWPRETFEPAHAIARKRLRQAGLFASLVEARLLAKLVGQSEAVEAMKRLAFRLELRSEKSGPPPLALFMGPPGVGKSFAATLFAEALAEWREEDTPSVIKIEMTQHVQWSSGVDLFGSPGKSGSLTDRIERHPRSVVVVEEFEKGCAKALEAFLPALDTGRFERESGKVVDFQQAVFIFTSNLGRELWENPSDAESDAFAVDLCDLMGLHGTGDERSDWYKTAIPRELISRLANGTLVLFHEHQGHHHLNLIERSADRREG